MAKEVNLLSYWMPFLRNIRELKEIAKAEEPELRYILKERDRALDNLFIATADEYGIKRFESMMRIVPEGSDNLETRRFRVLTKWNDSIPYTEPVLYRRLLAICGSDDAFDYEEHYKEYWLRIVTHLGVFGAYDMIAAMLDEMLPCNLVLELENILNELNSHVLYLGGVCCTAFGYCITHDIKAAAGINAPINVGIGNAYAGAQVITNDIEAKAEISSPHNEAVVSSIGGANQITHDIELIDALDSPFIGAVGVGTAHTQLITHDINSTVSNISNATVANPVGTATVLTINNSREDD